jgi:tetratricopeptide (TPR) repeat protein
LLVSRRFAEALHCLRELAAASPDDPGLWFELGIAAGGELDFPLANEAFQNCARISKSDASMLVLVGRQYHLLRKYAEARDMFNRAVAANPGSVDAQLTLAASFEREGYFEEAMRCVTEVFQRHPKEPAALYYQAFLLHRQGNDEQAEAVLRELINSGRGDSSSKQSAQHLLAVILDNLGEHAEALEWLSKSKALLRGNPQASALMRIHERGAKQRRELVKALKPEHIARWKKESDDLDIGPRIALLGGHPRSGTTLIEQVLGAHPSIRAFDETESYTVEMLNQVAPPDSLRGLTLDGLNSLSAATRSGMQQRYLKSLVREVQDAPVEDVFLDKNPSTTSTLPLWLRMFPHSKVVIPLRDPRDVVISCYFQNLGLTASNVNFLTIEGAAAHYADLMGVWLRMRDLGGFDWLESRYEDMVNDLGTEGSRVTQFLGLEWIPQQEHFREMSAKKFIFSPTYSDVSKPVHKKSLGRWVKYSALLEPVMAQLKPYCKAMGYE